MPVYLIGAGPGDPDLITLKAVKALNKADVVLYDYLANDEILKHAPDDAELIYVGKKAGEHYKKQPEINELLVEQAEKHENVVRLKGGDPFVFGRGGEELLELAKHNIVVTGHEDPTKPNKQVKWDYTADTLIILMGIGNIKENTEEIMKYRDPNTPACAIESGTMPNERVVFGTLGTIADKQINTPAILVIGNVIDVFKEIKGID